jgi:hypothetical protein
MNDVMRCDVVQLILFMSSLCLAENLLLELRRVGMPSSLRASSIRHVVGQSWGISVMFGK